MTKRRGQYEEEANTSRAGKEEQSDKSKER